MKITSVCLAGTVVVLAAVSCASTPPGPGAVAVVDGEAITAQELVDELVRQHGEEMLEKLIYRKVLEQAIKREDVRITKEMIDADVALDRRSIEFKRGVRSQLKFEREIRRRFKMSVAEYRQDIVRTRIFVREMVLRSARAYDEDYMRLWYIANKRRYTLPERIHVAHILIQHTDPKTGKRRRPEKIIEQLEGYRKKIRHGRDTLASMARRYSEDGDSKDKKGIVGWIPRQLKGEFPEAAWRLAPGEVSKPVRSAIGYHLIQRLERLPRKTPAFEEIKAQVRGDYIAEIVRTEAEIWIQKLMEKAVIQRRLRDGIAEQRTGKRVEAGERFAPLE